MENPSPVPLHQWRPPRPLGREPQRTVCRSLRVLNLRRNAGSPIDPAAGKNLQGQIKRQSVQVYTMCSATAVRPSGKMVEPTAPGPV
jgi:hypothetical protein